MTRFILRSIIISTLIFPVEAVRGKEIIGPYVANQFYPADPKELNSMLDSFLEKAPKKTYEGKLLGAMVPHAGYIYSGSTAAEVYKLLEGKTYKTVILLGTGHHYGIKGAATITRGVFRTPLGDVPINTDLAKHLIHLSPLIENNLKPYKGEHSIEVQIPFLQKVLKKFTLVPLLLNTQYPDISQAVGKAISEIAKTPGVLILISTDLSHYPDKDTANLVDSSSLKALPPSIEDPLYFWLTNRILLRRGGPKLGTTYCGEAALLTALFAFKELEANQTVLVSYTNSGMLENGDPNKAVGYATALWTKNKSFISDPHPLTFTQKQTLLKLARQSIEDFLKKPPRAPNPDSPAEQAEIKQTWSPEPKLWEDIDFNLPANVFVTLKKRGASPGQDLRGCVGSTQPQLPLAEAVQRFAVASAVEDHRFQPVTPEELSSLKIEISKLSFYQQVKSLETIQPTKHGVLLFQGDKSGLFLPQVWEQIPDRTAFLSELCRQKAELPSDCWKNSQTQLLTFTVEEFSE